MPAKRAPRGKQSQSSSSGKPARSGRPQRQGKPGGRPTGSARPARKAPSATTAKVSQETFPVEEEKPGEFRLQKFLASAGLGSRRQCEELIRTGRITVDGLPIDNPGINIDPLKQVIEYDGERLKPERLKYFVLNKPKGVLCTNHDPAGRTRVIDLFAKERVRLFPVGRLDEDSEGLLIVTNDGDLANQLAHPRYRIYRTYRIQVAGIPTNEKLQELKDGMYFREGKFKVISVHRLNKQGKSSFLEVVLGQGHNREVRRLFARIGHKVISLERVAFGPVRLDKLKSGAYRELTKKELEQLREMLVRNRSTPAQEKPETQTPRKRPTKSAAPGLRTEGGRPRSEQPTDEKKRIRRPSSSPRTASSTSSSGSTSTGSTSRSVKFSARPERKSGTGKPAPSGEKRSAGARKKPAGSSPRSGKKDGPKTYDFG